MKKEEKIKLDMSFKPFHSLLPVEKWPCSYCSNYEDYKKKGVCLEGHKKGYKNCGR